jgi:hypothetical protein
MKCHYLRRKAVVIPWRLRCKRLYEVQSLVLRNWGLPLAETARGNDVHGSDVLYEANTAARSAAYKNTNDSPSVL